MTHLTLGTRRRRSTGPAFEIGMAIAGPLAVLMLGSAAAPANAQSSTLFGVLDLNARAVKNGSAKTFKTESTDGLSTSRIGFRGLEDLGDGLKGSFWLEAGLAPDTGSTANASKFFDRRATAGLIDPTLGEVRLGRDNLPTYNAVGLYDTFGTNGLGEVIGNGTGTGIISLLGSGAATLKRADNQISYLLPTNLGGVYGQVAASPAEGSVGTKQVSGRLGYGVKTFNVSLSYAETTVALDDKYKQAVLGGFYDFGVAKVLAQVVQSKYTSAVGGARKQNVYQLGAIVPLGSGEFHVGYIYGDMSGGKSGLSGGFTDADDVSQYAVTYLYKLSNRTALYGTAARLENKGASQLVLAPGASGMRPGENSTGAELGVRHSF